ncbi:MAG TPA: magnesium/cobalt transporter CorA [Deltaproteobacteria bacterium]|mgnify:CR=1 FL=1|nr:magnesium/cobalt transporter CorA [Deltaproteobacteria bacterium]
MKRFLQKRSKKAGLPPGSLVYLGEKKLEKVQIAVIDFDEKQFQEATLESVEECFPFKDKSTITWININGLHETDLIEKIGRHFGFHPLLQEDILNTGGRPKIEDFGDHIFVVLKMLCQEDSNGEILSEQISLIFGENYVITFQESIGDVFDMIRERIRKSKGRIRKERSDYLAYRIIDAIVDNYFNVLEGIADYMEDTEEVLLEKPDSETLHIIHELKNDVLFLRKSIWPLREVVNVLQRGESHLIQENTRIYFRDIYDHTVQAMDILDTFRDIISGMLDTYLSSMSNRMNEVMKVLTIYASIFIPLTFIAGVYGMNFEYMPELKWPWGYPLILGIMLAVGITMVVSFKTRKWF